jgi:hypothetical protein
MHQIAPQRDDERMAKVSIPHQGFVRHRRGDVLAVLSITPQAYHYYVYALREDGTHVGCDACLLTAAWDLFAPEDHPSVMFCRAFGDRPPLTAGEHQKLIKTDPVSRLLLGKYPVKLSLVREPENRCFVVQGRYTNEQGGTWGCENRGDLRNLRDAHYPFWQYLLELVARKLQKEW